MQKVNDIREEHAARRLQENYKHAFPLDFNVSEDVLELAHKLYDPMKFSPNPKRASASDHPLAALHQRVAYARFNEMVKKDGDFIEIGANARYSHAAFYLNRRAHGCTKTDGRDRIRHLASAASPIIRGTQDRELYTAAQNLAMGIASDIFCVNGWGECEFKAATAYAIFVQDISPLELALGMSNHETLTVHMWMHLLPQMLLMNEYKCLKTMTRFKKITTKKGVKKIVMGFVDDNSFCYEHDWDTTEFYLKAGCVDTPFGFGLAVEWVRTNGSCVQLKISKVYSGIETYRFVTFASCGLMQIPDFTALFKRRFKPTANGYKIPLITVDKEKVTKLYQYLVSREGKHVNFALTASYARSLVRRLVMGNTIIEEQWDLSVQDFERVVLSVMLLAKTALARANIITERHDKELDKLSKPGNFFEKWTPYVTDLIKGLAIEFPKFFSYDIPKLFEDKELSSVVQKCMLVTWEDVLLHSHADSDSPRSIHWFPSTAKYPERNIDPGTVESPTKVTISSPTVLTSTTVKRETTNVVKLFEDNVEDINPGNVQEPAHTLSLNSVEDLFPEPPVQEVNYFRHEPGEDITANVAEAQRRLRDPDTPVLGNDCLWNALGFILKTASEKKKCVEVLLDGITKAWRAGNDLDNWLVQFSKQHPDVMHGDDIVQRLTTYRHHLYGANMRYVAELPLVASFVTKTPIIVTGEYRDTIAPAFGEDINDNLKTPTYVHFSNNHFSKPQAGAVGGLFLTPNDITFEEHFVIHGVRNPYRNHRITRLGGFAGEVGRNTRGGYGRYLDEIVRAWRDNSTTWHMTDLRHPNSHAINIKSEETVDCLKKLCQVLEDLSHGIIRRVHIPFVGGGLWRPKNMGPNEAFAFYREHYRQVDRVAERLGIQVYLHSDALDVQEPFRNIIQTPRLNEIRESKYENPITYVNKELAERSVFSSFVRDLECSINNSEGELERVLRECLAVYSKERDASCNIFFNKDTKYLVLEGVPGAGKTASLRLMAEGKRSLFISPVGRNVAKNKDKGFTTCMTQHKGMLEAMGGGYDLIIIDECFACPVALTAFLSNYSKELIMVGDRNQIGSIDFTKVYTYNVQLADITDHFPKRYLNTTYRLPKNVLDFPLIKDAYPNISTCSDEKGALHFVGPSAKIPSDVQVITFLQSTKAMLSEYSAMTAHEAQGQTFDKVMICMDGSLAEKNLLERSRQHAIVAVTRHRKELFVRAPDPGTASLIGFERTQCVAFDILTEDSVDEDPFTEFTSEFHVPVTEIPIIKADVSYQPSDANFSDVDDVLQIIYPIRTLEDYVSINKEDLEYKYGGKALVRVDDIHVIKNDPKEVRRFPIAQRCKVTRSGDAQQSLHTLMARYTKITKNADASSVKEEANRLLNVLKEYLTFQYTEKDKREVFEEAIDAFQRRGHTVDDLLDIDAWQDRGANVVKFNMKQQQKVSLNSDPLTKDKAGQGIAAWSKTLNFTMIVWTRLLERIARRAADKRFFFSSGLSDQETMVLLETYACFEGARYMEGDWTEFDSSQNNIEHELFSLLLKELRCPEKLGLQFVDMMRSRYVMSRQGSVNVRNKKDSGRVDTLIGNTLFNASVLLSVFDRTTVSSCFFKGDDSLIVGANILPDYQRLHKLSDSFGFILKLSTGDTAEFTSFLVHESGVSINLPRFAAKTFTRLYTEREKFDEYVQSVADRMHVTDDVGRAAHMCTVNACHFKIDFTKMDLLMSALMKFARGFVKYDDLQAVSVYTKVQGL